LFLSQYGLADSLFWSQVISTSYMTAADVRRPDFGDRFHLPPCQRVSFPQTLPLDIRFISVLQRQISFSLSKRYPDRFERDLEWEWSQMHRWLCGDMFRCRVPPTHTSLTGSSSPGSQQPCFPRAILYSLQADNCNICHLV
jgi:hypothetical protein